MRHSYKAIWSFFFLAFFCVEAHTQNAVPEGWHLLDYNTDSVYGISLDKALDFIKDHRLKAFPVTVAVLDSGVDTTQNGLKPVLWHNPGEIPDNGIDDDHNGYVDDIYGWNFLGNAKGVNLLNAGDEKIRIYYRFLDKFSKDSNTIEMSQLDKYRYLQWKNAAKSIFAQPLEEQQSEIDLLTKSYDVLRNYDSILLKETGLKQFSATDLENFIPKTQMGEKAKYNYLTYIHIIGADEQDKDSTLLGELNTYISGKKSALSARLAPPEDIRKKIIGDNYNNINDKFYGNDDVSASDPMHGTHVTGIIAAVRHKITEARGVDSLCKVMMVRVVPDGDEADKDIALGIFYAVNNGAKVINMSFGKYYSPDKNWVDSAINYALSKDVLIVHAAGNENQNLDSNTSYPSNRFLKTNKAISNMITVGASSDIKVSGNICAEFSNYGKISVDLFAPGVKIYSTLPWKDQYGNLKGTSMATPVVTGVAALLKTYFPQLTAIEIKHILMSSVVKPDSTLKCLMPGVTPAKQVSLSDLCVSGGIVNAYNAVVMAYNTLYGGKKIIRNKDNKIIHRKKKSI